MNRSNGQVGPKLTTLVCVVLAAIVAVAVLAQFATLTWFFREQLNTDLTSRRSQWGLGLLLGALAVEVACVAVGRLVVMARQHRLSRSTARWCVWVIAGSAGCACAFAVWIVSVWVSSPFRAKSTFGVLFAGAAVVAAGAALLAVALGRMLARAADQEATAVRLQAELDSVI